MPSDPHDQDAEVPRTFYDAMKDVIGIVTDAPADLSENPKYMEDFGRDCQD